MSHAYNHGPKELETIEEEHDEDEIDAGSQSDEDMPNLKKEESDDDDIPQLNEDNIESEDEIIPNENAEIKTWMEQLAENAPPIPRLTTQAEHGSGEGYAPPLMRQ